MNKMNLTKVQLILKNISRS